MANRYKDFDVIDRERELVSARSRLRFHTHNDADNYHLSFDHLLDQLAEFKESEPDHPFFDSDGFSEEQLTSLVVRAKENWLSGKVDALELANDMYKIGLEIGGLPFLRGWKRYTDHSIRTGNTGSDERSEFLRVNARRLYLAKKYPSKRVAAEEILPELNRLAKENGFHPLVDSEKGGQKTISEKYLKGM